MVAVRGITAYGANRALDALFGSGSPTDTYIAFGQSVSNDVMSGEPAIGVYGYSRIHLVNNATNYPAASGGAKTVGGDVVFGPSSGAWNAPGTSLAVVGIYDAASGGNLLGWATLPVPPIVNGAGITVKLLTANSDIQIALTEATT
jgi:hypothetical protein